MGLADVVSQGKSCSAERQTGAAGEREKTSVCRRRQSRGRDMRLASLQTEGAEHLHGGRMYIQRVGCGGKRKKSSGARARISAETLAGRGSAIPTSCPNPATTCMT
jgi:hypothetical protein